MLGLARAIIQSFHPMQRPAGAALPANDGKALASPLAAGSYPLNSHATEKYRTVGYKTSGAHPRPAIELGNTEERVGILVHPADGYASTIGCINLAGVLADADSDIELSDSTRRVIDVIGDLKHFEGGLPPNGDGESIPNCFLDVRDPPARPVAERPARAAKAGRAVASLRVRSAAGLDRRHCNVGVLLDTAAEHRPRGPRFAGIGEACRGGIRCLR
jgi:hypothetical protein